MMPASRHAFACLLVWATWRQTEFGKYRLGARSDTLHSLHMASSPTRGSVIHQRPALSRFPCFLAASMDRLTLRFTLGNLYLLNRCGPSMTQVSHPRQPYSTFRTAFSVKTNEVEDKSLYYGL